MKTALSAKGELLRVKTRVQLVATAERHTVTDVNETENTVQIDDHRWIDGSKVILQLWETPGWSLT